MLKFNRPTTLHIIRHWKHGFLANVVVFYKINGRLIARAAFLQLIVVIFFGNKSELLIYHHQLFVRQHFSNPWNLRFTARGGERAATAAAHRTPFNRKPPAALGTTTGSFRSVVVSCTRSERLRFRCFIL